MDEYSQRKANTPAPSPIVASGILSSSTKAASDLVDSGEHEVGTDELGISNSDRTAFNLPIGHENSNPTSLSWSLNASPLSMNNSERRSVTNYSI